jgi:hypothetical protein
MWQWDAREGGTWQRCRVVWYEPSQHPADLQPWKTCFPYKSSRLTGVSKSGLCVSSRSTQFAIRKAKMPVNEPAGTIFIRENTLLPGGLIIETETFLPGWRAVRNCDGYRLGRKIEEAKWNFFYLAGELKVILLGREGPSTFRRAVRSVLARPGAQKFNSLEITGTRSRRFLGIPFVIVTANFRHIQQGLALDRAIDFTRKGPVTADEAIVGNRVGALVSSS